MACLEIPYLDAPVATAADNPRVIELQAGHTVIVRCQPMDRAIALNRPDAYGAVRPTGDKRVTAHLQLSDQRGVALEDPNAVPERQLVAASNPQYTKLQHTLC